MAFLSSLVSLYSLCLVPACFYPRQKVISTSFHRFMLLFVCALSNWLTAPFSFPCRRHKSDEMTALCSPLLSLSVPLLCCRFVPAVSGWRLFHGAVLPCSRRYSHPISPRPVLRRRSPAYRFLHIPPLNTTPPPIGGGACMCTFNILLCTRSASTIVRHGSIGQMSGF